MEEHRTSDYFINLSILKANKKFRSFTGTIPIVLPLMIAFYTHTFVSRYNLIRIQKMVNLEIFYKKKLFCLWL